MAKTKSTKRALLLSALTLLVCVSMLIGTTFAWFTDSVSSNNNIITAGNLDVELEYYDGDSWEKVTATTNVFEEDTLWEPGHTEVVYLRVSNLGSLALKYDLGINIINEVESINVDGETIRLSEHIKFGVKEDIKTPYADRAAARAAIDDASAAILSTGYTKTGSIESGAESDYVALVVYMPETVGNEANYRTGEVAPQIDLGINLMATQYTSEKDSFDNKYDENAKFDGVPAARVTVMSDLPTITTINGNEVTLNTGYVFNTTDTYDQAQLNAHRYWHADFVASFDKDVDDAAIGLAGQYDYYSPDWLAFELDGFGDIAANAPVRMLEYAGISMNYEELCSIVKKFSCGAFAVDPAKMAGITMNVELRLYETTVDPNTGVGDKNIETGEYITIGTYSYTFDAVPAATQTELNDAIANGATAIALGSGEYTIPDSAQGKTLTIKGNGDTTVAVQDDGAAEGDIDYSLDGAKVVFDNVTLNIKGSDHPGYARMSAVYNNCTIVGSNYTLYGDSVFNNCTFNLNDGYVWTWGAANVEFNGCTFEDTVGGKAKAILVHNTTETVVTVKDCTFIATTPAQTWDGIPVAAVSIDPENGSPDATVHFKGTNTYSSAFNSLYQVKYADEVDDVTITVDGVEVTVTAMK